MSLRRGGATRFRRRTALPAVALIILAGVVFAAGGAGAAGQSQAASAKRLGLLQLQGKSHGGIVDASRFLGRNSRVPVEVAGNKFVPMRTLIKQRRHFRALLKKRFRTFGAPAAVGDTRAWLALDDSIGFYRKQFVLRKLSGNTEIWVAKDVPRTLPGGTASGTNFLPGDCRNGERTTINDAQVDYLAQQFDQNILPKESVEFSVAPDRTGAGETATAIFGTTFQGVPIDPTGAGQRTVVLIDNVRDSNFYDFNNTQGNSYIAGFFSAGLNALFDRNVMSIDAFDWLHRTGANPPHQPVAGNLCTSAPARPFLYEGVFAHEYQHLLQSYQDPTEVNFINEGLSDFAIDVTGYDFATRPVSQIGFDSHLQCFMGNLVFQTDANPNPRGGGPENSLTLWGDQGDGEILCDYGAAFSFMEYLSSQYGRTFMSELHRNPIPGLPGLQDTLGNRASAADVIHRWAAAMALDGVIDRGANLRVNGKAVGDDDVGASKTALYQIDALDAGINWDNPDAYSTPGAPPNGSDYVRLRDGAGQYLSAKPLKSLSFVGARTLEPLPVEWTVTTSAPDHAGDAALAAPDADNKDAAIVHSVSVPAGNPTLTFDTLYSTEPTFDSFFIQVSTDGGATYHSLANADTTCALDPGAEPALKNNCPGLNGESGGWKSESFDLTPYAGQTVLLAFRYITDANTRGDGVWVDNVKINNTLISDGSSLAGWQTFTQIKPIAVNGYTVQIVGYSSDGKKAFVGSMPLSPNFRGELKIGAIDKLMTSDSKIDVVAALVMYDEPTESINQYARYTLRANDVVQPGG
jgi:hypothetical protein